MLGIGVKQVPYLRWLIATVHLVWVYMVYVLLAITVLRVRLCHWRVRRGHSWTILVYISWSYWIINFYTKNFDGICKCLGASLCNTCPPRFYCDSSVSTSRALPCPKGYYCPQGTGLNWSPCPVGTYGNRTNLMSVTECTPCDAGQFCSNEGKFLNRILYFEYY
jgi:hypothetical protein